MRMSMTPVAPEEQPSLRQIVQVTEERLLLLCKRNPLEWPGNQPLSSLVLRGEAFTPPDKPGKQSMSPLTLQEQFALRRNDSTKAKSCRTSFKDSA